MAVFHLPFLLLLLALSIQANSHNITSILDVFPEYSVYNSYLSQTKLCDEINSQATVTCLVLSNTAMSSLAADQSLVGIKNALRLLILLDYFDPQKLRDLPLGTTTTSSLYQITGNATGSLGFVNITNLRGARVSFSSAKPGSMMDATYTRSVQQIPYNLSVIEISGPITFPGLMDAPTAPSNLTALLEKAGCKTFASLITSSGMLKVYQSAMDWGFTLFAPQDNAFKADGVPDLNTLSSAELVAVLQYHALPSYTPMASLKITRGPIATMASSGSGNYDLSVISHGDNVSLDSGINTSHVASIVLDETPICILTVDSLLLPSELFGDTLVPAPLGQVSLTPSLPATAPAILARAPAPVVDLDIHKRHPPPHHRTPPPRRRPPPPHRRPPPSPSHHHPPPAPVLPPDSPLGPTADASELSVVTAASFILVFFLHDGFSFSLLE